MCATHTASDFRKLRHRWEMPLIWVSIGVTVLAVIAGVWIMMLDEADVAAYFGDSASEVVEYAGYAALLPLMAIVFYIVRFYMAARAKANAIRVGPKQMPEIWQMYQELNEKIGLNPLPKLYVTNGNGVVNAYALWKRHRRFSGLFWPTKWRITSWGMYLFGGWLSA